MKIICLQANWAKYSCSSYMILGDWNRIEDVNTLIDAGVDGFVLKEIGRLSTGVGKRPVEQLVLTHGHFDHCSGAQAIKEKYACQIYGFSPQQPIDQLLQEGQTILCGDRNFTVIHTPGHSGDSICLYCAEEETLFSGDTQLFIKSPGGSYTEEFVNSLKKISNLRVAVVYPGHGEPIWGNVREMINNSLRNVLLSQINP
jgi:glyoxylase-like metal-dependent hydrolase (beta-lactamase superfamily II)